MLKRERAVYIRKIVVGGGREGGGRVDNEEWEKERWRTKRQREG